MKLQSRIKELKRKAEQKKPPKKNRMIVLRKKQLTAIALMMLVAAAGYLNYTFKRDIADPDAVEVYNEAAKKLGEAQMVSVTDTQEKQDEYTNGYFSEARMEKETKREESIDTLLELINSAGADKAAKEVAQTQIGELTDYTEKEVMMENMIRAKGYSDAVVFMGENLVSVAVFSAGLNDVDSAVISDIATSVTGYSVDKVNIVEVGE
ncbi:MAG: SpoIIIAH-like family protein [Clostridia bacterium]|nr:SpoIIIAH-like family protein [Clostridia bacterium]